MNKTRLEAFSDGVFAIAITLLVLDIRLPEAEIHSEKELLRLLAGVLPAMATFVFSFLVVGVFWVAHHRIFDLIKSVNHYLLWSNIFYLLTVALIPFPASVLAKHPFHTTSVIFYSAVLFLCGFQHFFLLRYTFRHQPYRESSFTLPVYRRAKIVAAVGPVCYLLSIVLSFVHPVISFGFIGAALVFYIFLAPRFLPRSPLPQPK